jgi:hypothetical protein
LFYLISKLKQVVEEAACKNIKDPDFSSMQRIEEKKELSGTHSKKH